MNKREKKFYASPINRRIREYLLGNRMKPSEFAREINARADRGRAVTNECVRQWCEGYARPDHERIPVIADIMKVTCDYLYGRDVGTRDEEATDAALALRRAANALLSLAGELDMEAWHGNGSGPEITENG